jgi:hypothetical protein
MTKRGSKTGADRTASKKRSTAAKSPKTAVTASPTRSAIAKVAHQLWLDDGCPIGSDQEHWFQAEKMLRDARVGKCEDSLRRPSTPRCETLAESEIVVEFQTEGHWEVWESEWGGARWVWDLQFARRDAEVPNRSHAAGAAR